MFLFDFFHKNMICTFFSTLTSAITLSLVRQTGGSDWENGFWVQTNLVCIPRTRVLVKVHVWSRPLQLGNWLTGLPCGIPRVSGKGKDHSTLGENKFNFYFWLYHLLLLAFLLLFPNYEINKVEIVKPFFEPHQTVVGSPHALEICVHTFQYYFDSHRDIL